MFVSIKQTISNDRSGFLYKLKDEDFECFISDNIHTSIVMGPTTRMYSGAVISLIKEYEGRKLDVVANLFLFNNYIFKNNYKYSQNKCIQVFLSDQLTIINYYCAEKNLYLKYRVDLEKYTKKIYTLL